MSDPTAWPAGKTFGELTPAQKIAAGKRAAAQLQDELQRNAPAISAAMDAAEAEEQPVTLSFPGFPPIRGVGPVLTAVEAEDSPACPACESQSADCAPDCAGQPIPHTD
jgi:hypothetical protein